MNHLHSKSLIGKESLIIELGESQLSCEMTIYASPVIPVSLLVVMRGVPFSGELITLK